jgi:hypothetical protein
MAIYAADFILPLVTGKKVGTDTVDALHRYAGVAVYIGSYGLVATCAHIVESLDNEEILMAKDFNLDQFFEVQNIVCHPSMDFAVGQINVKDNSYLCPVNERLTPIIMGTDVSSFGHVNIGKKGIDISLKYRFFKGYISFLGDKPDSSKRSKSLCEVSFPSLAGFSGAPVFLKGSDRLVGMLYGNNESNIEVFSFSEIADDNKKYSEKVFRTIEFGLVHTISDIISYLDDLDIKAFS